jgi:hypothetical protein
MSSLVRRENTPRNLAVVGGGSLAVWALVSLVPFFPLLAGGLLVLDGYLKYRQRNV